MSLLIDVHEHVTYLAYIRCGQCDASHEGGEVKATRAAAETSACDAAKADGWKVTGNSALCPTCQPRLCASCGDEVDRDGPICVACDEYDPTPYEIGEPDNLPREAQERAAESMRMKR